MRLLVGRFRLPPDPIWYKIASTTGSKPGNGNGRMNMSLNQVLYSTVAAIGIAALATSVAPVSAQPKPRAKPGQNLDLTAVAAPSPAAAAHYYPAIYWYTMMKIPPAKDFGGSTDIPKTITRENWIRQMNNTDCVGCHQLGQEATRTIPAQFGKFSSGADAWQRRITSGQSGEMMTNRIAGQFGGAPYKYFGDWTDRVAKGELPKAKPPRPSGVERNIVITSWEWSTPDKYL